MWNLILFHIGFYTFKLSDHELGLIDGMSVFRPCWDASLRTVNKESENAKGGRELIKDVKMKKTNSQYY